MRYPADEKHEIIRLVDASHLGVRRTLDKLSIAKTTFYHWYESYQLEGVDGLVDKSRELSHVWNRDGPQKLDRVLRWDSRF
jgi:transposase-like protein